MVSWHPCLVLALPSAQATFFLLELCQGVCTGSAVLFSSQLFGGLRMGKNDIFWCPVGSVSLF